MDTRGYAAGVTILLFICALAEPLILAHADGFQSAGLILPVPTPRPQAMSLIHKLCLSVVSAALYLPFLIGQYSPGALLFAAPVDFAPPPESVVRSPLARAQALSSGAAFVWCTLAALSGTPLGDPAARAALSCRMFQSLDAAPLDVPPSEAVEFAFGVTKLRSLQQRPDPDHPRAGAAARALHSATLADAALRTALLSEASDSLLEGWVDRITPLVVGDIPAHLLEALPDFSDARLDDVLLSKVLQPLTTSWYPLPPEQPNPGPGAPTCPRSAYDLLTPAGAARLSGWIDHQLRDLAHIRAELARGTPPGDIGRDRPDAIAIGQSEFRDWARGLVWDCTLDSSPCCVVAAFHQPPLEIIDRAAVKQRLSHYPDQALVSHLVLGARTDADVELQFVLVPHLTTLPFGFQSVLSEVDRLEGYDWYRSFASIPYAPMYFNGQGATSRKLEPDRWRRTTEGGGPRHPTFDAGGVRALSLNEAARIYHMPEHFSADQREPFLEWLRQRGLPRDNPIPPSDGRKHPTKWPKEVKPALEDVMRDMAVLGRAALRWDTALYCSNDDIKDYFNHLAVATSELSKVGILLDRADGAGPRFVSERVLGFGLHGSSNLAQRFSDALVILYYENMDLEYFARDAPYSVAERSWLEHRLALQQREGEPCVDIRQWTAPSSELKPPIPAPAVLRDIPAGYVCPQLRPYRCYIFTDDAQMFAVGTRVKIMSLRAWRRLTNQMRLRMAIAAKRSLGTWCKWIGVLLIPILGLVVVTRDKILRANMAIGEALADRLPFHVYRALCGLLEHLRSVNLRGRNIMHGLYRPHGPGGASREGPAGVVKCDTLMRSQLIRWQRILTDSCGVSVKRALLRENLEVLPTVSFELFSDACYADVSVPGVGGYLHGLYWYFPVPADDIPYLSIPILEFLGAAFNVIMFYPQLHQLGSDVAPAWVNLYTDALTTARVLSAESAKSTVIVEAYQHLICSPAWRSLYGRLRVAHVFGDANVLADLISRARWGEFRQLCAMLGVRPQLLELSSGVQELYRVVVQCLRERAHLGATARGVFNPHLIGDQPIAENRSLYDLPLDLLVGIIRLSARTSTFSPVAEVSRTFRAVVAASLHIRTCTCGRTCFRTCWLKQDDELERQLPLAEWTVAELMLQAQSLPLGPLELGRLHRAELAVKEYRALEATLTYSREPFVHWGNPMIRSLGDGRFRRGWTEPYQQLQAIKGNQAKWSIVEATLIHPLWSAEAVSAPPSSAAASSAQPSLLPPPPSSSHTAASSAQPSLPPPPGADSFGGDDDGGYSSSGSSDDPIARYITQREALREAARKFGATLRDDSSSGGYPSESDDDDRAQPTRESPPSSEIDDDALARPTVTSTTMGSHNISMDGRPVAHPGSSNLTAELASLLHSRLQAPLAPADAGATPVVNHRPAAPTPIPDYFADMLHRAISPHRPATLLEPPPSLTPATVLGKRRLHEPGPLRQVGGLQMPPAPPWARAQSSGLALASSEYARLRALALAEGGEPGMAIRTELTNAMATTAAVEETIFFGINANTLDTDVRAWDMWEHVCRTQGTSPLRTAAEARDFPERNAHLLACLLLHAFATGRPRDRSRAFIKPRSALAYPLAIVRVFARWGVIMPSFKVLKAAVAGLSRAYLSYYGPFSLAPRRAEPMKFSMVRELYAIPASGDARPRIGRLLWSDSDHHVFIFRRLICVLMVTAFRLGEIVSHSSGEIMYLTFESLTWVIGGVVISHPTAAQLAALRPGIDGARLAPPRSKPDQMGEIHCPFSAVLTYHPDDPINAAAALRDLELRVGCTVADRGLTPLFGDSAGEPYTHHFLHSMLRAALAHLYGEKVASLYSFHSFRSGLASALHAAGVADPMIQLICRWMCPESLHVYRRMGVSEHETLIRKASGCHVDCTQSINVPTVVGDQHMAALNQEFGKAKAAAEQQAYEEALRAATDPFSPRKQPRQGTAATMLQPTPPRAAPDPAPEPRVETPVTLEPCEEIPEPGAEMAVCRTMWPDYPCDELGGQGWRVLVLSATPATATIRFIHARARGRRYEDVRIQTSSLKLIKPLHMLDQQGP